MQATRAGLIASSAVVLLLTACSSSSSSNAAHNANGSTSLRDGMYTGRDTYPISFTLANAQITNLHGTATLNCAGGPDQVSQISPYSDPDTIAVNSDGTFSDDYKYLVGNGTWTFHVDGTVAGDGTATGLSSILGVGCSSGRTGWGAALPDAQVPQAPTPPTASAIACSPAPCQTENDVTLSVQSSSRITRSSAPSTQGVDVVVTVVNNGSSLQEMRNGDFYLKFANGDVAHTGYLDWVDSSGQSVPCFSLGQKVPSGQQVQGQHLCVTLSNDETGQQMELVWTLFGPPFDIPVGTLH